MKLVLGNPSTYEKWLSFQWPEVAMVVLSAFVTYLAILVYTRMAGLRSFSKISAADFAMTVAVGSLFASTISSPSPSLVLGLVAIAMLFFGQWFYAAARKRFSLLSDLLDNRPLLLMANGEFIDENLKRAHVTRNDVFGKLRKSSAMNYDEVRAVVFETTGDISIIHSHDRNARLEEDFLSNVIGYERLFPDAASPVSQQTTERPSPASDSRPQALRESG